MKAEIEAAMDELDAQPMLGRQEMFESVQSRMTGRLAEQLKEDQLAAGEEVTEIPAERLYQPGEEVAPAGETRAMTLVEALNTELTDAMAGNDNMVILGEDVAREGGVFRVTAGLYDSYGRGRMMDTPLCELGIVGSAIGMAMAGVRPVCEIEFAGFTFTAYDQIIFHLARYHWRSNGKIKLPVVIRMPVAGGHEGLEGHCDSPEALFTHPPGLTVVYPSNAYDAKGLLASALQSEDPVIFFEPVAKYFVRANDIPIESYTIPIGKAKIVREGTDLTIVTYGNTVQISEKAADMLKNEGVFAEVIDLRTLKPWDEERVLESVEKTGRLLVVHEAGRSGGMASEIITTVCEKACDLLETPPARVTHADVVWAPARLEPLSLITPERIAATARGVMED
jgi:pyruvate dehydrogenase E1 component beta subunit